MYQMYCYTDEKKERKLIRKLELRSVGVTVFHEEDNTGDDQSDNNHATNNGSNHPYRQGESW